MIVVDIKKSGIGSMTTEKQVKVLYIAGWGRSGSTILASALGQIDGFFSAGELNYIWDRSLTHNRRCGCGVPFRSCEVWTKVLNEAFGGVDQIDASEVALLAAKTRMRHAVILTSSRLRNRIALSEDYLRTLQKLYLAIQKITGSKVIVDSSKSPVYAFILSMIPAIDLYIVHLVRDPRAVAYSWLYRRKPQPDLNGSIIEAHGLVHSSLMWNVSNVLLERFWKRLPERYLLLRYEDFVRSPRSAIKRVLSLAQANTTNLPFEGERNIELHVNHTVAGNPDRFTTGLIEVRSDEEWKINGRTTDNLMVTAMTWPLLRRYDYPSNPRSVSLIADETPHSPSTTTDRFTGE